MTSSSKIRAALPLQTLSQRVLVVTYLQEQAMERCDGPGIIALVSAALAMDREPYLGESVLIEDLDDIVRQRLLLPDELELDCRATLDIIPGM